MEAAGWDSAVAVGWDSAAEADLGSAAEVAGGSGALAGRGSAAETAERGSAVVMVEGTVDLDWVEAGSAEVAVEATDWEEAGWEVVLA